MPARLRNMPWHLPVPSLTRNLLAFWKRFDKNEYTGHQVMEMVSEDIRRGRLGIPSFVD